MIRSTLLFIVCSLFGTQRSIPISIATKDTAQIRETNAKFFLAEFGQQKIDTLMAQSPDKSSSDFLIISKSLMRHQRGDEQVEENLSQLAANSELVIEGTVQTRHSMICEGETFVCSDYEVQVNRVFSNHGVAVLAGQTVVVARPGGVLAYGGRSVRGVLPGYDLFRLGERYIFYLRLLPDSGSFFVYRGGGFRLTETGAIPDERTTRFPSMSTADFVKQVEKSTTYVYRGGQR